MSKQLASNLRGHIKTLRAAGRNDGMVEDMEKAANALDPKSTISHPCWWADPENPNDAEWLAKCSIKIGDAMQTTDAFKRKGTIRAIMRGRGKAFNLVEDDGQGGMYGAWELTKA